MLQWWRLIRKIGIIFYLVATGLFGSEEPPEGTTAGRDHCRKGPLPEGTAGGREQFYMQCCYNVHSFSTLGLVAVNFCYLIFLSGFYSLFLDFVIWLWWRFERNVSLYVLQDALILSYPPHVSLILSLSYPLNRRLLSYPISRRTCHKIH